MSLFGCLLLEFYNSLFRRSLAGTQTSLGSDWPQTKVTPPWGITYCTFSLSVNDFLANTRKIHLLMHSSHNISLCGISLFGVITMIYGHFFILSSSSNVWAQFVANGRVTTSILFCISKPEKNKRSILMERAVDFEIAIIIFLHIQQCDL